MDEEYQRGNLDENGHKTFDKLANISYDLKGKTCVHEKGGDAYEETFNTNLHDISQILLVKTLIMKAC